MAFENFPSAENRPTQAPQPKKTDWRNLITIGLVIALLGTWAYIIWDKGHGQPAMHGQVMNSCYEMILILEDDKRAGRAIQNAKFKRGEMNNILRIGRGEKISDVHGAIYPEMLVGLLINAFSEKGNLIYDPFMGSGTTGIVAHKLERNWIGSEITEEYSKIAQNRIQSAIGLFSITNSEP